MEQGSDIEKWVLITGASTGIGEVFAKRLAEEGYSLVLVARSFEKLEELSQTLGRRHHVGTFPIQADLTDPKSPQMIEDQITRRGIFLYGLINNAGCGVGGKFADVPIECYLHMINLNVRALVELTGRFLPGMASRGKGFIINVSSTASFQPLPFSSVYAATKSFVTSFTEALWMETRKTGVRVLNLCPGLTKTPFGVAAGIQDFRNDPIAEEPEKVVEVAIKALSKSCPTVVSGWHNRLLVFLERFMPHRMILWGSFVVQNIRGRSR